MNRRKTKVCLLVNMISPARLALYSALADQFDLLILHGGTEANRTSWRGIEEALPNARIKHAWGWQFSRVREENGRFIDRRLVHIRPGYIQGILSFRPEVLVSNEMGLRTVIALAYGTLFRKPVWVWWGGTRHTERKIGAARKFLRKLISNWANRWISYGRTSTDYLLSIGIEKDRILELQNAVDERRFAIDVQPEFFLWPRPVLLHVGQLIARKGIDLLLEAVAAVQSEGLEFSLLLVGGGLDEPVLKRLGQDLRLKNVHFRPEQPPEKMPAVYRSGDVLIFPTVEDVWGLVANEAILSGLPVLCSKFAGCSTELFPSENIFDPHNPEEFKQKLRAAVAGQLAGPDRSRLRPTIELARDLIQALEESVPGSSGPRRSGTGKTASSQAESALHENMPRPQQL